MTISAYIGLGSNLDNPLQQLHQALEYLGQLPQTILVCVSRFYGSNAIGPGKQPDYINAAALIHTSLNPDTLLVELQSIEQKQGRQRGPEQWIPRTLDLDLLLYSQHTINTPHLQVPHPRIQERNFVLQPLLDLAPELVLPSGESITERLQKIGLDGIWPLDITPYSAP